MEHAIQRFFKTGGHLLFYCRAYRLFYNERLVTRIPVQSNIEMVDFCHSHAWRNVGDHFNRKLPSHKSSKGEPR